MSICIWSISGFSIPSHWPVSLHPTLPQWWLLQLRNKSWNWVDWFFPLYSFKIIGAILRQFAFLYNFRIIIISTKTLAGMLLNYYVTLERPGIFYYSSLPIRENGMSLHLLVSSFTGILHFSACKSCKCFVKIST